MSTTGSKVNIYIIYTISSSNPGDSRKSNKKKVSQKQKFQGPPAITPKEVIVAGQGDIVYINNTDSNHSQVTGQGDIVDIKNKNSVES